MNKYKDKAESYIAKHLPFAPDDIKSALTLHIAVALYEWEKEKSKEQERKAYVKGFHHGWQKGGSPWHSVEHLPQQNANDLYPDSPLGTEIDFARDARDDKDMKVDIEEEMGFQQ